jgi:phospholipase C
MAPSKPLRPDSIHSGWFDLAHKISRHPLSRRQFIARAMSAAGGLALAQLLPPMKVAAQSVGAPDQANWPSTNKIKHIVILCQENRSFDHYFGSFASMFGSGGDKALGFTPAQLTYANASGEKFHPYHLTHYCDQDPDHSWDGSHLKWDSGKMDGWVTDEAGSTDAIGYFEPSDHIYHVQLAQAFSLADHYFCSEIGPTLPNRLYLWTGTSGWDYLTPTDDSSLPYNNPSLTAPPLVLTWPTMADVLDAAGLPWKCYSVADGSIPSTIGAFNPLIFFEQILTNPAKLANATADISQFFADLAAGELPAVSWIVTEAAVCEHPPAPPDMGQLLAARIVEELMSSSAWESTAMFLTYDEGGGFFEHVPPHILETVPPTLFDAGEAVGPGFRVPLITVSPWVKPGSVFKGTTDHTSILQFVERTFSTKTKPLHLSTIAPKRRTQTDLSQAFDFAQTPITPSLPTAADLYSQANDTVLTLNGDRTVADCTTNLPSWLPSLLGVTPPSVASSTLASPLSRTRGKRGPDAYES